jgi:hypothetical protein
VLLLLSIYLSVLDTAVRLSVATREGSVTVVGNDIIIELLASIAIANSSGRLFAVIYE